MSVQPDTLRDGDFPVPFGRYTLLGLLGEGGMARVFKAELQGESGFRKKAAVKIIRAAVTANNEMLRASLINEARLGGLLHHPNVVETYDYGEVDGFPYIAMELVRGIGLDQALQLVCPVPAPLALEIVIQIASGLDHAHNLDEAGEGAELVHRDLKPSNVIISRDGLVKVMDFGIAKASAISATMTETGMTKGTPAYMSPEQIAGGALDRRSDLFAVGAILYELILGERLFDGDNLMSVLMSVVNCEERVGEPQRKARLEAAAPGLWTIINNCLRKAPDERFSGCAEVEHALRLLARTIEPPPPLKQWTRDLMKRNGIGLDTASSDGMEALNSRVCSAASARRDAGIDRTLTPAEMVPATRLQTPAQTPSQPAAAASGVQPLRPPTDGGDRPLPRPIETGPSVGPSGVAPRVAQRPPAQVREPPSAVPPTVAQTPAQVRAPAQQLKSDGTLWRRGRRRQAAAGPIIGGVLALAIVLATGAAFFLSDGNSEQDSAAEAEAEGEASPPDLVLDIAPAAIASRSAAQENREQRRTRREGGQGLRSERSGGSNATGSAAPAPSPSVRAAGGSAALVPSPQPAEDVSEEPSRSVAPEPPRKFVTNSGVGVTSGVAVESEEPVRKPRGLQATAAPSRSTERSKPAPPPSKAPVSVSVSTRSSGRRGDLAASSAALGTSERFRIRKVNPRVVTRGEESLIVQFDAEIRGIEDARVILFVRPRGSSWLERPMKARGDGRWSIRLTFPRSARGDTPFYVEARELSDSKRMRAYGTREYPIEYRVQ